MICVRGGVATFWLILLRLVIPVFAQPGIHCVNVGQNIYPNTDSIGADIVKPKDIKPFGPDTFYEYNDPPLTFPYYKTPNWQSLTCPRGFALYEFRPKFFHSIEYCPPDVVIRAYLVRQNERVLRGWLHFEIELTNKTDEMQWIYVQARDEHFNAIGEFVTNDDEQCSSSNKELISPSKYQILPCNAVGLREAKASQGVFVPRRTQYANTVDDRYLPKGDLKRGIHLTWRLNEYWCNRHLRIRLDAHIWTTQRMNNWRKGPLKHGTWCLKDCGAQCRQKRKVTDFWLYPHWFGAADIKINGPLDCSTPAIDFTSGAVTQQPDTWLKSSSPMTAGTDYNTEIDTDQPDRTRLYLNCQVDSWNPQAPSFGGRCEKHISSDKSTSSTFLQGCIQDSTDPEFAEIQLDTSSFVIYSEYVNHINTKRLKQCTQMCVEPDDKDIPEIQSFTKVNASEEMGKLSVYFKTLQDARLVARANTFFQTRKYHGNLCIFITMFLLPVSNFLIRYYKETFMHHMSLGCAPWFWFHMFVCMAVPTLYRSSYSALQESILNFGTSNSSAGTFHRWCGNLFVIVFLLMVVLGGARPVVRGSRLVFMAMHSVTGFGLYFLAIFLVINSTYIPASPTVHKCDEKTGVPITTEFSYTAQMIAVWFFIDLLFHLLLTIFQFVVDKKYEVERYGFMLPIVPILPAESWSDLKGSVFRMIVLLVYVSLSLGMTFTTIRALFIDDDQKGCELGEMSCNISEIRPNMSSSPFGCYSVSLRYYAAIFGRYDIHFNETDL